MGGRKQAEHVPDFSNLMLLAEVAEMLAEDSRGEGDEVKVELLVNQPREYTPWTVVPRAISQHPPPPAWLDTLIQGEGGIDVMFVLQKPLMKSDVDHGQSRFSIPQGKIQSMFLTEEERITLDQKTGSITIKMIQPCRESCFLQLRKWDLKKSFSYVLVKAWNQVVKNSRNALRENVEVRLWSFRACERLSFAMVRVNDEGENGRE